MFTPSAPKLPRLDCSLFFPDLINFHMQNNPTLPIWVYPNDQGITEITFLEFGRAAHRIAHAIRPDRTGDDGQVVILIANTDTILHQTIVAGMSIAGLVPFLVSPRNSPAAVIDMMKKIDCSRIVTLYHAHQTLIDGVREQCSGLAFTVDEIPTILYALPKLGHEVEADTFVLYPQATSRPDQNIPSMYLHSSGSTGFPKPVPQSYKVQIHWMYHSVPAYFPKLSPGDRIGAMALPPYHVFGIIMQLYLPLAYLVTITVYPPLAITDRRAVPIMPTSDNILDSLRRTHCKVLITVPTFLEQWAASAEAVEALTKLDQVVSLYGGGPLAEKIGNILWAAGVNMTTTYGGTEFGSPIHICLREEIVDGEWMWLRMMEDIQVRWVPLDDDTYECQILTTENNQMAIENLPDVRGYATSDLFIKHPTKNLWKIVGRADDVITLASGEKTVPIPMEGIITAFPLLQGVVMFGGGRNQVGVLVEPRPEHAVNVPVDENTVTTFRNVIWPVIEEANKIAPGFARIFKEMILIGDPAQPIIRTPKGTVQRKATIKAYEAKINSLDMEATSRSPIGSIGPLKFAWTTEGVLAWLTEHASTISQGRSLDHSADLFAQGFDSLSATYLRNRIADALFRAFDPPVQGSVSVIPPNIVFENPTFTCSRLGSQASSTNISILLGYPARYVASCQRRDERPSFTPHQWSCVTYWFHRWARVVPPLATLAKPEGAEAFVDKGLSVDLLSSEKLVYVEADASLDHCGVSPELYEELSLVSFEPNIKATRNLVDLALDAKYRRLLRFVFTSTIGTAQSWDRTKGAFPEEPQLDPSTAVGSGYGESKYVCERIIAKSGLRTTSLRIGQIAGGQNGSWATSHWVPIIVKSSIALGSLPNSIGVVSWMRAADVAAVVLDIAFADSAPQSLNIVNPQRARWSDVITSIRNEILEQKALNRNHLTIVPLIEWVVRLEKKAASASPQDLADIPALKLLEFFNAMARNADELSQTQSHGSAFEAGGFVDLALPRRSA
ncbi:acetyl-CoA synthetase-like protein [Imleria badia]|nr:acetyl-CoA synthetase-like protein [Imleria badia]